VFLSFYNFSTVLIRFSPAPNLHLARSITRAAKAFRLAAYTLASRAIVFGSIA
jgi:hypothetical protein